MSYENTDELKSRFITLLVKDEVINDNTVVIPSVVEAYDLAVAALSAKDYALTKPVAEENKVVKEETEKAEYKKPEIIAPPVLDTLDKEDVEGSTKDDVFHKVCKQCGKKFTTKSRSKRLCDDCAAENQKRSRQAYNRNHRKSSADSYADSVMSDVSDAEQTARDILALGDD